MSKGMQVEKLRKGNEDDIPGRMMRILEAPALPRRIRSVAAQSTLLLVQDTVSHITGPGHSLSHPQTHSPEPQHPSQHNPSIPTDLEGMRG